MRLGGVLIVVCAALVGVSVSTPIIKPIIIVLGGGTGGGLNFPTLTNPLNFMNNTANKLGLGFNNFGQSFQSLLAGIVNGADQVQNVKESIVDMVQNLTNNAVDKLQAAKGGAVDKIQNATTSVVDNLQNFHQQALNFLANSTGGNKFGGNKLFNATLFQLG